MLPAKRQRRTRSAAAIDPENNGTASTIKSDDQENQPPSVEFESVALSTPPKRGRRELLREAASKLLNYGTTDNKPIERLTKDVAVEKSIPITPQTPRHYDVFASTPRHRVMSAGKLSRRLTPQTPRTPTASQTVYHVAKQLFSRSSDPGQLVGREEEQAKLRGFLERCETRQPSGCIYVSGPPGTGKSAMVNEVSREAASKNASIRKAYINCMSIKSSKDLYVTLLDQLDLAADVTESDAVEALQKTFLPKRKTEDVFLVVLDEIDHVLSMDLESLYRLFEWSLQKKSRLALVGIANALDLTDRFLPRLKSRNLKPELLPFLPYTATQIKNVIASKLKSLLPEGAEKPDYIPFFHPAAIELCSRKVSTQTGDLRRAFEICRRAIDLVESETKLKCENDVKEELLQMSPSRKVLGENANLASSPRSTGAQNTRPSLTKSLQSLTVENAPRVSIGHLNKVTAAAFSNGTNQRLRTLNLQQKAALCALMAIDKRNKEAKGSAGSSTPSKSQVTAPTIKELFDTYCLLCKRDSILHPLSSSEFREVVGSLETLSLIAPVDGKTGSFTLAQTPSKRGRKQTFGNTHQLGDEKRVASCVGDKEIGQAVEGLGADILKSILSGEALD